MATRAAQGDPGASTPPSGRPGSSTPWASPRRPRRRRGDDPAPEDPSPWFQLLMLRWPRRHGRRLGHGRDDEGPGPAPTARAALGDLLPGPGARTWPTSRSRPPWNVARRRAGAPGRGRLRGADRPGRGGRGAPPPPDQVRPEFDWARRRLALNLSGRRRDPRRQEALKLVDDLPKGAESPDDRMLRAVVYSPAGATHRREAIATLEGLSPRSPTRPRMHVILAQSLRPGPTARAREHAAAAPAGEDARPDAILLYAGSARRRRPRRGRGAPPGSPARPQGPADRGDAGRILHARKDDEAGALPSARPDRKKGPGAVLEGRPSSRSWRAWRPDAAEQVAREVAPTGPTGKLALAEFLAGRGREPEARALVEGRPRRADLARPSGRRLGIAAEPGADAPGSSRPTACSGSP